MMSDKRFKSLKEVDEYLEKQIQNEKRFTFVCDDENCRFKDNGETIDCVEVVDLLNEQQATIDQLNLAIDDLLSPTSCDEVKKENEQLRNIIKQKEEEEQLYAKEILRLNELNKQTSEFTDILGGY